jgi:hypothetical protein
VLGRAQATKVAALGVGRAVLKPAMCRRFESTSTHGVRPTRATRRSRPPSAGNSTSDKSLHCRLGRDDQGHRLDAPPGPRMKQVLGRTLGDHGGAVPLATLAVGGHALSRGYRAGRRSCATKVRGSLGLSALRHSIRRDTALRCAYRGDARMLVRLCAGLYWQLTRTTLAPCRSARPPSWRYGRQRQPLDVPPLAPARDRRWSRRARRVPAR